MMEEQREAIRHSNRPLALIVLLAGLGLFGYLVFTADNAEESELPLPITTTSVPATSTTSTAPATTVPDPILNLGFWWVNQLEPGESNPRVRSLESRHTMLLTDHTDFGALLAPRLRRLDPQAQDVMWTAEGREGSAWRRVDPILADGVVIVPDRPDEPDFETSLLWGFDLQTGATQFAVLFRNDVVIQDGAFATVLDMEGNDVVLVRVGPGRLLRIDPFNGNTMWEADIRVDDQMMLSPSNQIIARSGDQVLALDPHTGETVGTAVLEAQPRVAGDLANGASVGQVLELGDGTRLLSWSFPEDSPVAPGVARIDEEEVVLWQNEGRPETRWQDFGTFQLDGVGVWTDLRWGEPSGAMVGFDLETGNRLWVSQFRVPEAPANGFVSVSMQLRSGETVLVTWTDALGLVRVSPLTGSPMWSADVPRGRIVGSVRRGDRSQAVAVVTDEGNIFLDVETGERVSL